jgi:hypothetical protein
MWLVSSRLQLLACASVMAQKRYLLIVNFLRSEMWAEFQIKPLNPYTKHSSTLRPREKRSLLHVNIFLLPTFDLFWCQVFVYLQLYMTHFVQWLRLSLSKGPSRTSVSLSWPEDESRPSFRKVMFYSYLEFQVMDKAHKYIDSGQNFWFKCRHFYHKILYVLWIM